MSVWVNGELYIDYGLENVSPCYLSVSSAASEEEEEEEDEKSEA